MVLASVKSAHVVIERCARTGRASTWVESRASDLTGWAYPPGAKCSRQPAFEVCSDKAGKVRFRLKASNGQVVATGEAYETKTAAKDGCEAVQRAANGAEIVETDA